MGRHKKILMLNELKPANIVTFEDEEALNKTIKQMKDILYSNDNLVMLTAPQIGVNETLFSIKFSNGDIKTFINPLITHTEGVHASRENNISLPDKEYIVPRYNNIEATFQTPTKKIESNRFEGVVSEIFQQAVQMLDGIYINDFGLDLDDVGGKEVFDNASEEEKQELFDCYINELQATSDELQEEINNDDKLSRINKSIDFMTSVATGETELLDENPRYNRQQRRALNKLAKKVCKKK